MTGISRREQREALALRSDAGLLASSDPEAFGVFYDRHITTLLRYFYRRTACSHSAADLAAETFTEALRHRSRYDESRGEARAWLFGIAHNRLRRFARKGAADAAILRRLAIPTVWNDEDLQRVEEIVDSADMRTHVLTNLGRLSPALRRAVELRVIETLPYAQVAQQLGCSEGAARVRVTRALSALADTPVDTSQRALIPRWTPT